ncbi:MAG: arylesterase [Gammaproteobacteria bacterium]
MTKAVCTILLGFLLVVSKPALSDSTPVILVVGDSLSAAYGIDVEEGWVALLERRLSGEGYPHRVVNASISGETTRGGRRRLAELLSLHEPSIVAVELGGNDGLRGIPLAEIERNLTAMREAIRESGAVAIVLRMALPPNYGPDYTRGFNSLYDQIGEADGVFVTPFFLGAVALNPELLQADGLHPTVAAQAMMLDTVWPTIAAHLEVEAAEKEVP